MTENWYDTLPKKRSASGVLLFNESGHLLIVKPSYKEYWSLPGGVVDDNESPRKAAIREVKEEIGIDLPQVELKCMDYMSDPIQLESYQMVFDGGILSAETIQSIKLDPKEISDYGFYPLDKALALLGENTRRRLTIMFEATDKSKFVYLEQGCKP